MWKTWRIKEVWGFCRGNVANLADILLRGYVEATIHVRIPPRRKHFMDSFTNMCKIENLHVTPLVQSYQKPALQSQQFRGPR